MAKYDHDSFRDFVGSMLLIETLDANVEESAKDQRVSAFFSPPLSPPFPTPNAVPAASESLMPPSVVARPARSDTSVQPEPSVADPAFWLVDDPNVYSEDDSCSSSTIAEDLLTDCGNQDPSSYSGSMCVFSFPDCAHSESSLLFRSELRYDYDHLEAQW